MLRGLWLLAVCPGCSLLLDFSDSAAPHDAGIDAPYSTEQCAYKEPNDTPNTAAPVTMADTGPAAICPKPGGQDDQDYYRFTVTPGANLVTVTIMFQEAVGDLDLQLLDASASSIAYSRGVTDQELIRCPGSDPPCPALAAGDYLFRVFPSHAGVVNHYVFSVLVQ
jgi:hypothetical protein